MSGLSNRMTRRNAAKQRLDQLFGDPDHLNVIHYSCESFYDNPGGGSRRVTSIAVLHVGSGQTTSFSIHQVAERQNVEPEEIDRHYDEIEQAMLAGFYEYVQRHPNDHWLHWNMRDSNYGFPAVEHRFEVLGGVPVHIPESHLMDLADALPDIFGDAYMEHGRRGRLDALVRFNGFEPKDFLAGRDESDAFLNREYVKLHQSTLRKARLIHMIGERAWDGRLRTQSGWWDRHGATIGGMIEDVTDHPAYRLISAVFAIIGVAASVVGLVSIFR